MFDSCHDAYTQPSGIQQFSSVQLGSRPQQKYFRYTENQSYAI